MHEITFRQALREALAEEMERDPSVFLMGLDIGEWGGSFKVTDGLLEKFGGNPVIEMPISESGFTGAAVGAALLETRPVVELLFGDFLPLVMDQLVNHAAKTRHSFGGKAKVPMVLRTFFGAGTSAGSSHSQSLEAWVVHCPWLKVVMPSTLVAHFSS